ATLTQEQFAFQECRLPGGTYTVQVRAKDDQGGVTAQDVQGDLVVQAFDSVRDTLSGHSLAQRIRLYTPPCPSPTVGTCDAPLPAIVQAHPASAFDLFRRQGANEWYLDPANVR